MAAAVLFAVLREGQDAPGDPVDRPPNTDPAETAQWPDPPAQPRDRGNRTLLELVGVTAVSGAASAIIRERGGEAHTYRVGDRVAGGLELIEIHDYHVILRDEQRPGRKSGSRLEPPNNRPMTKLRPILPSSHSCPGESAKNFAKVALSGGRVTSETKTRAIVEQIVMVTTGNREP